MERLVVEKISNKEAMNRVKDYKLVYRESYLIGEEKKTANIIDKRFYKKQ